jgi:2-polyprenyl-3-methyl-5-hydroxy-6-metoxy-1,4-benzoquinol methylase
MSDYSGTENLEVMADAINYNDFLVSLICKEVKPGELVVDFGAGIGTFSKQVAIAGHAVHCVEPDQRQLERLLALGLPASENIANFENESIDLVYTLNVLEHIENDLEVLKACFQKIKPGGYMLIYVPAFNILFSSMDKNVGHLRRYTRSTLAEKVRLSGFTIVRNEYVDSAGFFASLLFKMFGNDSGTINRAALIFYDRYVFPLSRFADLICNKVFGKNVYLIARRP